jgi:hypothetical protein
MAAASGAELVMDYRRDNVVEQVRAWSPGGVDRIIEVDLASNLSVDAEVVAPEGAIMVYSLTEKAVPLPWTLNNLNARIEFMLVYTIPESAKMAAVVGINNALADRALSAATAQRFPLGQRRPGGQGSSRRRATPLVSRLLDARRSTARLPSGDFRPNYRMVVDDAVKDLDSSLADHERCPHQCPAKLECAARARATL